jgi:hypothetical protein
MIFWLLPVGKGPLFFGRGRTGDGAAALSRWGVLLCTITRTVLVTQLAFKIDAILKARGLKQVEAAVKPYRDRNNAAAPNSTPNLPPS